MTKTHKRRKCSISYYSCVTADFLKAETQMSGMDFIRGCSGSLQEQSSGDDTEKQHLYIMLPFPLRMQLYMQLQRKIIIQSRKQKVKHNLHGPILMSKFIYTNASNSNTFCTLQEKIRLLPTHTGGKKKKKGEGLYLSSSA